MECRIVFYTAAESRVVDCKTDVRLVVVGWYSRGGNDNDLLLIHLRRRLRRFDKHSSLCVVFPLCSNVGASYSNYTHRLGSRHQLL
ncbi:hypothetical protein L2E82_25073 [Cichorium intybus]|uniref:Uncharacterized protein n=1 Tax=Cichorium intybus TaxID=13427 RepID=A0ACB9E266_CICIN|nr:hypothetical protein L2E82_25073 [Cichorium intybus]